MTPTAKIRQAVRRTLQAVRRRPAAGRWTADTCATVVNGCTCKITEGPWTLVSDLPDSEGGDALGPSPGALARGALASCLTMGIVMRAAELEVPIDAVLVEVQGVGDARGYLGLDSSVPAGYTKLNVVATIRSMAPEEKLRDIFRHAERHSPVLDVFRRPNLVEVDLRLPSARAP